VAKIIHEKGGMKEEVIEARPHRTGFGWQDDPLNQVLGLYKLLLHTSD